MVKILGVNKLRQKLKALATKIRKELSVDVIVGYTAEYAVHVHENMEVRHPNGQAKFLEQPFRENIGEIGDIVFKTTKATGSLLNGLLLGGMFLQRKSQELVPVDTGNLKGSAFTRKE